MNEFFCLMHRPVIFSPSIDVNGGAVSVVYDGSIAIGNGHSVVGTRCGDSFRR